MTYHDNLQVKFRLLDQPPDEINWNHVIICHNSFHSGVLAAIMAWSSCSCCHLSTCDSIWSVVPFKQFWNKKHLTGAIENESLEAVSRNWWGFASEWHGSRDSWDKCLSTGISLWSSPTNNQHPTNQDELAWNNTMSRLNLKNAWQRNRTSMSLCEEDLAPARTTMRSPIHTSVSQCTVYSRYLHDGIVGMNIKLPTLSALLSQSQSHKMQWRQHVSPRSTHCAKGNETRHR